ncbi:MAG: putative DNA-binding protein [Psychromonas sp.]
MVWICRKTLSFLASKTGTAEAFYIREIIESALPKIAERYLKGEQSEVL